MTIHSINYNLVITVTRFRRNRQLCESKERHRNDAVVVTAM